MPRPTSSRIEFGWTEWAVGAIVPGLAALALLPLIAHWLVPPTLEDARAARESAGAALRAMGPWSRDQKIVGAVLLGLLALWATTSFHGYPAALVAWIGIVIFLLTRIQSWDDVVGNTGAWDIMLWLGGLLALATALREEGRHQALRRARGRERRPSLGPGRRARLCVVYFFSMYAFSMLTAHISAFAGAFFVIALAAGSPALVMVPLFAYFSNLCGSTTNYSTGPVIIYFGLGLRVAATLAAHGAGDLALPRRAVDRVGLPWWKAARLVVAARRIRLTSDRYRLPPFAADPRPLRGRARRVRPRRPSRSSSTALPVASPRRRGRRSRGAGRPVSLVQKP